jgi:hypothetical protein
MTFSARLRQELAMSLAYNAPLPPIEVGQRVRTMGAGGPVALWMQTGVVVRFTRVGNPVVLVDAPGHAGEVVVTDTAICFRRVTDDDQWVRP